MFGPSNDEFKDFKSHIDSKINKIESLVNSRITDSEESARASAENAKNHENSALTAGEIIRSGAIQVNAYKEELLLQINSLKEERSATEILNSKLQENIAKTQEPYSDFLEKKEDLDNRVTELSEKIESTNGYLEKAKELPGTLAQAQESLLEVGSIGDNIKKTLEHALSKKSEIDELRNEILGVDLKREDGTSVHLDGIKDELEKSYGELKEKITVIDRSADISVASVSDKHDALLVDRQTQYESILKTASDRYEQVNTQLTGLLPGAMAEGLSAAYESKKNSEEEYLKKFEKRFSWAIGGLVAVSLIPFFVDSYLLVFKKADLVQVIKDTPSLILSIFPIYFPILWLAYSTGKKANLSKRLIEEYTHKLVLGKTFSGLSNQIETLPELNGVKEELRVKLLYNVLQVSSENPGKLITDYNKADHPLMDALEKSSKLSDALTTLEKIPGLSLVAKKLAERTEAELKRQAQKIEAGLNAIKDLGTKQSGN